MLRGMSASQFSRWMVFYSLEPWGFQEENRRVGVIAATTANVAGKTLQRPVKPDDFIPRDPPTLRQRARKLLHLLGGDPRHVRNRRSGR